MNTASKRWTLGMFVVIVLTTLGLVTLGAGQQRGGVQEGVFLPDGFATDLHRGPVDMGLIDPALVGAIDLHAHLDPDTPGGAAGEEVRAIDVIGLARLAKARGMRGFVHKTHLSPASAYTALLARQEVPGIEVFGRMALNLTTGGINPATVEHYSQVTGGFGRVIEMPTRDSENTWVGIQKAGRDPRSWIPWLLPSAPKFVPIAKNGELLPEVKDLIAKVSKIRTANSNGRLALATGHSTPEEHLLVAREGRKQGLQVLLTHPGNIPQLPAAASLGAFIEVNAAGIVKGARPTETTSTGNGATNAVEIIRKIGAEHIIIGTDCGQVTNPLPPDCIALAAKMLRSRGITERELDLMLKENPAKLLSLPPLGWTASPTQQRTSQ